MKSIWIPKEGGPEVLELHESPDPTPGPGEVRIVVEAAGLNFADLLGRMGIYPDRPPLPCVMGYEVAGTIDAVGDGVDESRVGDPVVAMCRFGGHSTHVVVPEVQAVERPEGLDAVTAAAIPVTYATAWMMLEEMGRVRRGDRVLVHSAGGGVGLAALDILRWRKAYAIGTASKGKHARLLERGYNELIDYRSVDFYDALKDSEPHDLILDPIGGDSWTKGLDLLRPGGRLMVFGMSANATSPTAKMLTVLRTMAQVPWLRFNPLWLMNNNRGVMGVNMGHMWNESERVAGWLLRILALWGTGVVRPHVHATVPFSKASEAHQMLHDRKNFGKVVLVPD